MLKHPNWPNQSHHLWQYEHFPAKCFFSPLWVSPHSDLQHASDMHLAQTSAPEVKHLHIKHCFGLQLRIIGLNSDI